MKKLLWLLVIGGALFAQTNLLQNPSFEEWDNGMPVNWQTNGVNVQQSNDARTGTYAAILIRTSSSHKRFEQSGISVSSGSEYTFRVYAKGTGYIRFGIQDGSGGSDYHYGPYTHLNGVTSWQELTWTYTVSASNVKFIISVKSTDDNGITIDDAFFGLSSGNNPPSISNVSHSPQNPTSSDNVTVTADIVDPDGDSITKDSLYYTSDGGSNWTAIPHSSVSGNTYTYTIPSQANGTTVSYYIIAEDNNGNRSTSDTYSYNVSDNPIISNITHSPQIPNSSQNVIVSADITDPNGDLSTDSLYYSTDNGGNWTAEYRDSVGTGSDTHYYTIPAQTNGTTVNYFIVAKDAAGNRTSSDTFSYIVSDLLPPVITEIMYNPSPNDNYFEFVEVYNPNDQEYDVSNWVLTGTISNDFTIPEGTVIPPYGYLVVCRDTDSIRAHYGQSQLKFLGDGDDIIVGNGTFNLGNGGDDVKLNNSNGATVDEVNYDDGNGWPRDPDGDGPSLGLKDPELDNNTPDSWCSETGLDAIYGGSPGAANQCGNATYNGGFEEWTSGHPTNWLIENGLTTQKDSTHVHRGSYCAKLSATIDGSGLYQEYQVSAGSTYRVFTWANAIGNVSGHPSVGIVLKFYDGSWNSVDTHGPFYPGATGQWKKIAHRGRIPSGASKLRIFIVGYSTAKGDAGYVDDVNFVSEGATATGVSETHPAIINPKLRIITSAKRVKFLVPLNQQVELNIYDATGRKIVERNFVHEITFLSHEFTSGVYFAIIRSGDKRIANGKFVILR